MATRENDLLFVYGTLLTLADHPLGASMREHCRRLGPGSIQARLYIIDDPDEPGINSYPGAVPSGDADDSVHGEVYRVTGNAAELFMILDRYEACSPDRPQPHEFQRRSMPVRIVGGEPVEATVYLYTWDVSRARHVPSGRYDGHLGNVR